MIISGFNNLSLVQNSFLELSSTTDLKASLIIEDIYYYVNIANGDLLNINLDPSDIDPGNEYFLLILCWNNIDLAIPDLPIYSGNYYDLNSNDYTENTDSGFNIPYTYFKLVPQINESLFNTIKRGKYLVCKIFTSSAVPFIDLNNISITSTVLEGINNIGINNSKLEGINNISIIKSNNTELYSIDIKNRSYNAIIEVNDNLSKKVYTLNSKLLTSNQITYNPNKFDTQNNFILNVDNISNIIIIKDLPIRSNYTYNAVFNYTYKNKTVNKTRNTLKYSLTAKYDTLLPVNNFLSDTKDFDITINEPIVWLEFFEHTYTTIPQVSNGHTITYNIWTFEVLGTMQPPLRWMKLNSGQISHIDIINKGLFSVSASDITATTDPHLWIYTPINQIQESLNISCKIQVILNTALEFTIVNPGSGYTYMSFEIFGGGGNGVEVELELFGGGLNFIGVINPGYGFQNIPYIKIIGDGVGCIVNVQLKYFIDEIKIVSSGENYTSPTLIIGNSTLIVNVIDQHIDQNNKLFKDLNNWFYCQNIVDNNNIKFIGNFCNNNLIVDDYYLSQNINNSVLDITGNINAVDNIFGQNNLSTALANFIIIKDFNDFCYVYKLL